MTDKATNWRDIQEPKAVFAEPAPWVNRFSAIVIGGGVVRITFLEEAVGIEETSARSAVMMLADDARSLAEMLLQLLPVLAGKEASEEVKVG